MSIMSWIRSKYGNRKTEYNGVTYDSKKEAAFAQELDVLKHATGPDKVASWEGQVPYVCKVEGKKICTYKADFVVKYASGEVAVYDVKGVRTAVYRLKKKLVEALYGIEIKEV